MFAFKTMTAVKTNPQIILRPQDLVVLLRLSLENGPAPTYASLADELCLTASEIHAGVKRAEAAQLLFKDEAGKAIVIKEALRLFVQHGARYAFPATRGSESRGMPTSYAAAPLADKIVAGSGVLPVWPYKGGSARGFAFYPLYPSVPQAAMRNAALYELLVLFDAIRGGSPRERALAIGMLDERLKA
ncbi:hypothetical protein [Undibacterium baiyunense]|uniref:Uncharacterized protein n=1 Tax=Undibacterium baiyunense TaxID=2828731 RepID=A0A941DF69_9BURK|nr:hypothetical protein [Undibacterium baiyunense]MBR7747763.1 hypothetical protein [Undibacterium baiyunense]